MKYSSYEVAVIETQKNKNQENIRNNPKENKEKSTTLKSQTTTTYSEKSNRRTIQTAS
jgi:hypothetical protein